MEFLELRRRRRMTIFLEKRMRRRRRRFNWRGGEEKFVISILTA